ncbi:hypothetical protein ABZX75_06070 [Streptomyces sp. NPDC003038]|uniref:hypothetical protein n=1 Tax=unclassified Streptomyces TaxID=2593676 RepID=UPI0033A19500
MSRPAPPVTDPGPGPDAAGTPGTAPGADRNGPAAVTVGSLLFAANALLLWGWTEASTSYAQIFLPAGLLGGLGIAATAALLTGAGADGGEQWRGVFLLAALSALGAAAAGCSMRVRSRVKQGV